MDIKYWKLFKSTETKELNKFPFKKNGNHYLVAVVGHQQLDIKAVTSVIGEKCEFESLEKIKEFFGIDQGGVPPFGNLLGLKTFFDKSILKLEKCVMGCGLPTESIIMQVKDLVSIEEPKICQIAK